MLNKKNIYLVIQYSGEPSGAEKRFINIWKEFVKNDEKVYLITHKKTLKFFSLNNNEKKKIILLETQNISFLSQYFSILKIANKIKKNSIIHFVNIYYPFLTIKTNSKYVISWLQPFSLFSFFNLKIRHIFLFFLSFIFSSSIDVLNPKNYFFYKKIFFFKKIHLSPTSVNIDSNIFKPCEKENSIVFLGRLENNKGINILLNTIKIFDLKLKNKYKNLKNKINFYILGKGSQEKKINNFIKSNKFNNINIMNFYTEIPEKFLNKSKIFLSIQKSSNYPSRSLVEAMYSGCIPIISNTGDSELMGSKKILVYVDKDIDPSNLSDIIYKILNYKNNKFRDISNIIRDEALLLFKNNNQFKYFTKLYFERLN